MSVEKHTQLKEKGGIYFFTTRINQCRNIFVTREYHEIIQKAFGYAENIKKVETLIRTIMPNHLHWIFKLAKYENNPIPIYQHFKRHTAKEVLRLLKIESKTKAYETILPFKHNKRCGKLTANQLLQSFRIKYGTSSYKVWESKPDLKLLYTPEFIRVKVNYVYENPFRKPWRLVNDPKKYPFTYVDWDLINDFLK